MQSNRFKGIEKKPIRELDVVQDRDLNFAFNRAVAQQHFNNRGVEMNIVQNELRKVVFEGKKSFADSQINPLYKRVRR